MEHNPIKFNRSVITHAVVRINQFRIYHFTSFFFLRLDGKYLFLTGNSTKQFQFGPFHLSKNSNHCLQFWYTAYGRGVGKLQIVTNTKTGKEIKEIPILNEQDQSKFLFQLEFLFVFY